MFQITSKTISFAKPAIPAAVNVSPMRLKALKHRHLRVGFHSVEMANLKICSIHMLHDVVLTIRPDMLRSSSFFAPEGHLHLKSLPVFELFVKIIPHLSKAWYTALACASLMSVNSFPPQWTTNGTMQWNDIELDLLVCVFFSLPVNGIMINWSPDYSDWSSAPNQTQDFAMTTEPD